MEYSRKKSLKRLYIISSDEEEDCTNKCSKPSTENKTKYESKNKKIQKVNKVSVKDNCQTPIITTEASVEQLSKTLEMGKKHESKERGKYKNLGLEKNSKANCSFEKLLKKDSSKTPTAAKKFDVDRFFKKQETKGKQKIEKYRKISSETKSTGDSSNSGSKNSNNKKAGKNKTRTIKSGRTKYLNIYKKHNKMKTLFGDGFDINELFTQIRNIASAADDNVTLTVPTNNTSILQSNNFVDLTPSISHILQQVLDIHDRQTCHSNPLGEYEFTLDMFRADKDPLVSKAFVEMAIQLNFLLDDQKRYEARLTDCLATELGFSPSDSLEEERQRAGREFKKKIKERGKKFISSFGIVFNAYGRMNCLMLIFVEVLKSQMKIAKSNMRKPEKEHIKECRKLVYKMLKRSGSKQYIYFFNEMPEKDFEQLFDKAYSYSCSNMEDSPDEEEISDSHSVALSCPGTLNFYCGKLPHSRKD